MEERERRKEGGKGRHDMNDVKQAEEDFWKLSKRLLEAGNRKSVPVWAVPNEIWRMAFSPDYGGDKSRAGVGVSACKLVAPKLRRVMIELLALIRGNGHAPLLWNLSSTCNLGKVSDVTSCK